MNSTVLESVPHNATVATLGPPGSFSQKAAKMLQRDRADLQVELFSKMRQVQNAVRQDAYALLPRVNYSYGPEPDNQTALFTKPWNVQAQVLLKVQMCIGGVGQADWDKVQHVHSKDVGLRQCAEFLEQHCPEAEWHEEDSTGAAAQYVSEMNDRSHVAVASAKSLEDAGLSLWKKGASNAEIKGEKNVTEFMLVGEGQSKKPLLDPTKRHHGLVLTPADRPGIMYEVDRILYENGMNKESQPEFPYGVGKYRFLTLFSKVDDSADVEAVLRELSSLPPANGYYPLLKSLGSWNQRYLDDDL